MAIQKSVGEQGINNKVDVKVIQAAIKALVKEGLVKNLDADVSRRTKKIIKPNWSNKSEHWALV